MIQVCNSMFDALLEIVSDKIDWHRDATSVAYVDFLVYFS